MGSVVTQVVAVVIGLAAFLGALGIIAKAPVTRWVWRRLVSEPFRSYVGEIVDEKLDARPVTNGWGTQAVKAIAETVGADVPPPKDPDEGSPTKET
jgi:hypothetical protein